MTNNPYQAPSSDVNNASSDSTYEPQIFSIKGRIGRLRYLAYSMLGFLAYIPMLAVVGVSSLDDPSNLGVLSGVVMALSYIVILVWTFILARRRFNDLNMTGWLSVTMLVPLLNLIPVLALLFMPGTKTSNKFGARPAANSTGVKIAAGAVILLGVVGIVSAIAIPMYAGLSAS